MACRRAHGHRHSDAALAVIACSILARAAGLGRCFALTLLQEIWLTYGYNLAMSLVLPLLHVRLNVYNTVLSHVHANPKLEVPIVSYDTSSTLLQWSAEGGERLSLCSMAYMALLRDMQ